MPPPSSIEAGPSSAVSKSSRPANSAIIQPAIHRPMRQPLQFALLLLFLLVSTTLFASDGVNGAALSRRDDQEANSVRHELAVYDNEILEEPKITCGPGVVHFDVLTRKGNASNIYVRGQSQNADCTFHNARNITVELAKCNVRRKREINPNPGIAYQMTLVVQLHPLFVTKVDRAYNVNCFYKEKPQDVSVDFGVSDIATQSMYAEPMLPQCTYSVHRDSPNGPRVKYTHVGEQLYHVWECPSHMYSMLLYNCQAIDGKGAEYPIIDANGCSKDQFLMPEITYTVERTKAMAASAAFNFPDRNTMSFTCKIKLCMNSDLECSSLTPPNCNGKRAKIASNGNFNEDTSGEFSANVTETPSSTRGNSGSSWWSSSASPTVQGSTATVAAAKTRNEISGEVNVADIEPADGSSSSSSESGESSSSTGSSTTTSSSSTTSSTSSSSSTTSTTTTTEPSTSTASSTSSSTTSTKSPSTTTEEQLLSSQERMSSASAESSRPAESSSSIRSSPSSWAASTSDERGGGGSSPTLATSSELPSDFPRPDLLLQKDQALLVPQSSRKTTRMERLEERLDETVDRADPSWTIAAEREREKAAEAMEEEDGFHGTTKPVYVFDKKADGGSKAAARAQRDTTRGPGENENINKRRKSARHVDFDISSPELMIMDDYEPAAAAQKQRNSVQEAPFIDWNTERRAGAPAGGVCLSPLALVCSGLLLLLLLLAVFVVLVRATRKGAGTAMEHSFYSN